MVASLDHQVWEGSSVGVRDRAHQNCSCPNCVGIPRSEYYATSPYYNGEAWHRVIPKRKSGDPRDPSQRRIAKYNYRCQRPEEYLEPWQSELLNHPRHIRWARRKRQSL